MTRPLNGARKLSAALRRLASNDEAIVITEYALLVALAAILLIVVVAVFGTQIGAWFGSRTGTITTL